MTGWSAAEVSQGTVLHLQFKTQRELCRAFVRIQEFYESPYESIRGCYFTLNEFKVLYAETHGSYSYNDDWHGFNIPGHIVHKFFEVFREYGDLTEAEKKIERTVAQIDPNFYLIGTHIECGDYDDAVLHEICHAAWYLDPEYQARAYKEVSWFWYMYPRTAKMLHDHLKSEGYSEAVMDDEFNAYLATTPLGWWEDNVGKDLGRALYRLGKPFRELTGVKC